MARPLCISDPDRQGAWNGHWCRGRLAWYANPLLLGAGILFLIKRDLAAACLAGLALIVGLTTLSLTEMPRNEARNVEPVVGYQIGFYLWITSMVVVLLSSLYMLLRKKRSVRQDA